MWQRLWVSVVLAKSAGVLLFSTSSMKGSCLVGPSWHQSLLPSGMGKADKCFLQFCMQPSLVIVLHWVTAASYTVELSQSYFHSWVVVKMFLWRGWGLGPPDLPSLLRNHSFNFLQEVLVSSRKRKWFKEIWIGKEGTKLIICTYYYCLYRNLPIHITDELQINYFNC